MSKTESGRLKRAITILFVGWATFAIGCSLEFGWTGFLMGLGAGWLATAAGGIGALMRS